MRDMNATTPAAVPHVPDEHRYEIHTDDELAGVLEYRAHDGVRDFIRTEVEPRFAGRGLAKQLVREALQDVRASGLRVMPVCSYVTRFVDESAEFTDIDVRTA